MLLSLGLLVVGLVLLALAADRFVLSASQVSIALGLSPILVGALVIGLGTSVSEMLVSTLAAGRGEIDLALGNVVGSNTANLTLVLGSAALVFPITSRGRTIRRQGALMLVSLVVFAVLLWNLDLDRIESGGLLLGMVVALMLLIIWARTNTGNGNAQVPSPTGSRFGSVRGEVWFGIGALALTLVGADLLIRGAARLADDLGISSAFVGLVIVSIGTSLPELATVLAAARRGETGLVLGNVLGSNLFNTLTVAGIAGLVGPGVADETFHSALVLMVVAGAVSALFALTGRTIERWEGAMLLILFLAFVAVAV